MKSLLQILSTSVSSISHPQCDQRWPPFSKSRESFKYKANHHVVSVASMAQCELTRSWGAMAPVVSYGILVKQLIYYPRGMYICDYDKEKKTQLVL